jgi:hypothetical protein
MTLFSECTATRYATLIVCTYLAFGNGALAQTPPIPLQRISIKFTEVQSVRLRGGLLIAAGAIGAPPPPPSPGPIQEAQTQLDAIHSLLTAAGTSVLTPTTPTAQSISPLMRDEEVSVDSLTLRLRQAGKSIPDMNNYVDVSLKADVTEQQIETLIASLRNYSIVQNVERFPLEPPPPPQAVDIAPPTPDFTSQQLHLLAPGLGPNPGQIVGIGAASAWALHGGKGRNVRVIDVEYIRRPHEDLPDLDAQLSLAPAADVAGSRLDDGHAAAVHGIIAAQHNAYGTNGIASDARYGLVSSLSAGFYVWNVPYAIAYSANRMRRGDVLLVEQQLFVSFNAGGSTIAPYCRNSG